MRRALRLAGATAAAALAACAAAPRPVSPATPAPAVAERRIMVTLQPAPPQLARRVLHELEVAYGLPGGRAWPMASLGIECAVFELPEGRPTAPLLRRLASDPRVDSVQPVYRFETLGGESAYASLQYGNRAIRADAAHRWATGKDVKVAVIDTGVDVTHPDLRGRVARSGNFVEQGGQSFTRDVHGTEVAGVIAASPAAGNGIVGVAPGADLFALKACWQRAPDRPQAMCDSYTLAKAVDFAIAEGAQVLNLSLAGPEDPLLARLLRKAVERGIVVVAAAAEGEGAEGARFPGSLAEAIAVHASGPRGRLRVPAPPGLPAPLAAPGVDVLTTSPHDSYDFASGSSFSAAHVSGLVALLLERRPDLTPAAVRDLLQATARRSPEESDPATVAAVVDACAALARLLGPTVTCPE